MKVYVLDADVNKYRGIYDTNEDDLVEFGERFVGAPMKDTWTGKRKFEFVPRRLRQGDTPGLGTHVPVFNSKAVEVLGDFLRPNGELLPITCGGERLFLYNVTRVIDALDEDNCELKRFDSGRIMDVVRFSFFEEKLFGIIIFKIPQLVLMDVFVTDPFVERVNASKLKGFKFRLKWSSD